MRAGTARTEGYRAPRAKAEWAALRSGLADLLDRRLEVLKVETEQGTEFVLRDDLEALKQNQTIVHQDTLVPPGSLGTFSGREGREYGFVKLLATDRDALARGLALSPDAVVEDQSLVGDWRPVMLTVEGPPWLAPRREIRRGPAVVVMWA